MRLLSSKENSSEKNKELLAEEFENKKTILRSFPSEITIALTTRCNVNPPCIMCDRNLHSRSEEMDFPRELKRKISSLLLHADILYLHCLGEPLLSDTYPDLMEFIRSPTKVRFSTNGLLLSEKISEEIVRRKIVEIIDFSLDAAREETYKKIRGSGFKKVIENVKRLEEVKKKYHSALPKIFTNMCLIKENIAELPDFIRLAQDIKAEYINLFHLNEGPDFVIERGDFKFDYKKQQRFDTTLHDEKVEEAYRIAKQYGIKINFAGRPFLSPHLTGNQRLIESEIEERGKRPKKCLAPWSSLVIGVDGNLRICCYQDKVIGNLNKNTFEEIWNSKKLQKIRKDMLNNRLPKICRTKNRCVYRERV